MQEHIIYAKKWMQINMQMKYAGKIARSGNGGGASHVSECSKGYSGSFDDLLLASDDDVSPSSCGGLYQDNNSSEKT